MRRPPQRGCARAQPAPEPEAQGAPAFDQAWQRDDQHGGRDTSDSHDREASAHSIPRARKHGSSKSQRRQGDAVDQAEHDKRKAKRTHAGRTGSIAADDGDPHRVVEAARKHQADQRGAAVAGRERERSRPLIRCEQPSPSEGLEALSAGHS